MSPKIFHPLSNLTSLDIGYCDLTSLDPLLFDTLTELTLISLDGNFLQELPAGMMKNSQKLNFINLSNNRLKIISSNSFGYHRQLLTVKFDLNKIDAIDEKFIDNIRVFEVDMTGNICADGFFSDWSGTHELIRRELRTCFDNYEGKFMALINLVPSTRIFSN